MNKVAKDKFNKSKKGVISAIYDTQIRSSRKRGHRSPEYTRKELYEWAFSQKIFHELYSEWVNSGHKTRIKPSIDRKYNDIHYCFKNIQLMTWEENNNKAKFEASTTLLSTGKPKKEVQQYTKGGELIAEYISVRDAGRHSGVSFKHISEACRGNYKTAGGYVWQFKQKDIA